MSDKPLPEMTPEEIGEVMLGPDYCAGRDEERSRILDILKHEDEQMSHRSERVRFLENVRRAIGLSEARSETKAAEEVGRDNERHRVRAIVLHFFGFDWHGQGALDAIDSGLTVEQLKERK